MSPCNFLETYPYLLKQQYLFSWFPVGNYGFICPNSATLNVGTSAVLQVLLEYATFLHKLLVGASIIHRY